MQKPPNINLVRDQRANFKAGAQAESAAWEAGTPALHFARSRAAGGGWALKSLALPSEPRLGCSIKFNAFHPHLQARGAAAVYIVALSVFGVSTRTFGVSVLDGAGMVHTHAH